jgi:hypothetical protein
MDALAQKFETLQWEAHVAQEWLAIVTVLNGMWDLIIGSHNSIHKGDS